MASLDGRVAVITGAAQGLGATYARALAGEGAAVVVADVRDGAPVAAEIERAGGRALDVRTDVADEAAVAAMVAAADAKFGRIDILINNAAQLEGLAHVGIAEASVAEWDRVMAVNVRGAFLCVKHAVPVMRRHGGKIINVASTASFSGGSNFHAYAVSKGAMITFTRGLAHELGRDGICVNAIAPGVTLSETVKNDPWFAGDAGMVLQNRRAIRRPELPEDLIGTILYLASSASDFVTGQTIVVDGGLVMH
ncbi:MAG: SDR family NAD(P)-dependent oxidoreductase [Rhodospirillales bacterium]